MLKNSDWMILNSITYKIQSIEDINQMRLEIMKQLSYLIDFDSSSFYLSKNNDSNELENPVGINYSTNDMLDYIQKFKDEDYSEGLMDTGKNIAYRESDIIEEKVRVQSSYYKSVYDIQGWHFSMSLNISYNEHFLGVMSFFRKKGKQDFTYNDIFVLDIIKDHLAYRLYRNKNKKLSIIECQNKYQLSKREIEVLENLITKKTMEEISYNLSISINTLHKHASHIYQKLNITSRVQLFDILDVCTSL